LFLYCPNPTPNIIFCSKLLMFLYCLYKNVEAYRFQPQDQIYSDRVDVPLWIISSGSNRQVVTKPTESFFFFTLYHLSINTCFSLSGVSFHTLFFKTSDCFQLLSLSLFKCRYGTCVGQTFLNLTRFVEILAIFVSPNKLIMKIVSMIYLMILIMYYKYSKNIFLYICIQI